MCTFFELQNLYAKHKDYASEIMQKGVFYDKSTIQELEASFRGKLFENNEEVVRSVFGNYVQSIDIHKRPLAKLTKDLVEQFGIFDSSYSSVTSQKKPRRRIEPVVASKPRN